MDGPSTLLGIFLTCGLRVILICAVPILAIPLGHQPGLVVSLLTSLAAATEVALTLCCRTSAKGNIGRSPITTKKFLPMLLFTYAVQIMCIAFADDETGDKAIGTDGVDLARSEFFYATQAESSNGFQLDTPPENLKWSPSTLSVILPCAEERLYALKTVQAVFENTPSDVLHEIVVVDDGSDPPLSQTHLTEEVQQKYKVKLLRHEATVGLIGAKKTGGDAATGDVFAFFDCHVAPQPDWYKSFLRLVGENYRRMIVPGITALDVGTWTQVGRGGGLAKCYLTWDADFKWFDSNDKYIAVISGGLLGMSKRWWQETGGYDKEMLGWGGENLDQSLRVWLCGGEIVFASDSQVAHMWRTTDPRTGAHYRRVGDTSRNRARAVYGWYGEFAAKLNHYPQFRRPAVGSLPWYGNLSNFEEVKAGCGGGRPFAWFLRRFRDLYEDAGMIPQEIFMLREDFTGKCLRYMGSAGTSGDGHGRASLVACDPNDHRFFWHRGNKNLDKGGACCSGLRAWNTDQCIDHGEAGGVRTYVCDVAGRNKRQYWHILAESGRLAQGRRSNNCLSASKEGQISESPCQALRAPNTARWTKQGSTMPLETQIYQKAQREQPQVFGALGVQHVAIEKKPTPIKCKDGAACFAVVSKDKTDRCFDEHGLLTTAQDYCSMFVIRQQTLQIRQSQQVLKQVVHAETGKCLERVEDNSFEPWGLATCTEKASQNFDGDGNEVCTMALGTSASATAARLCFELKPLAA